MKRAAWICSLFLALPLAVGCAADDTEESGDDSGSTPGTEGGTDESADASSGGGGTNDSAALECPENVEHDTTDGATEDLQMTWGAPCDTDSECVALLGEGGVCQKEAVLYELPGGYCTKQCTLPGTEQYVADDPACDPAGGVDCIGQAPLLQLCAPRCTDDAQCSREGYTCRNFPLIASEGDPMYCLMPDCCQDGCAEE